ncbi:S-adenosyl-L-methionine-dependent methyltransferase [Aspergillus affinis]|uniref:S-adenosyl-L-methionine-dependent methyltransferase n=1 Tax=Aspergillus affinis TaxID=1070780 RepID=UPI0022FED455|nr:S-adenosyl-L-methionine-dependent methyltransferase [Aspergillus affinis]KAI9036271.1 S-adenosyl-L-methionine-dependent methyltransferase [Aspergillus affinis]
MHQFHTSSALRIVYKFQIAKAVPLLGSTSYETIAEAVNLRVQAVERVIGLLTLNGIFRQPASGRVAHGRLSYLMATDAQFDAYIGLCFDDSLMSSVHIADALVKWEQSQENTEVGWNIANNTTNTFWQHLENNTADQERFSKAFTYEASTQHLEIQTVLEGFDWESLGDGTVVDVGGFQGLISRQIARHFPRLQVIVQDYEVHCQQGQESLPAELKDRMKFQVHDMFQPQSPISDRTAVYFLRFILHDWSDKYACKILQAILPAMKPGDRIVVCDQLIPASEAADSYIEQFKRVNDFDMWATFNGQERKLAHFKNLAKMADPRLKVMRTSTLHPLAPSLLEFAFAED